MNTLRQICSGILLERGLPIHYLLTTLVSGVDALRELSQDEISFINTKIVYIDDNGSIDLPDGFCDIVTIGVEVGQSVIPLSPNYNINNLPNYTSNGSVAPYTTTGTNGLFYGYPTWYGSYNCGCISGYKLLRDQNRIQLGESMIGQTQAILEYISDGMSVDAATKIHPHAYQAVKVYIEWKMDRNADGERKFGLERRKIRARRNNLTPQSLNNIINSNAMLYCDPVFFCPTNTISSDVTPIIITGGYVLTEDGGYVLDEDGGKILLET